MTTKSRSRKSSAEQVVKDIRRATRRQYSAEGKIRIVIAGLRGEESISCLQRDMVGPRAAPPILSTAALVKILSLHHELGQPSDAIGNAPGFV